MFSSKTIFGEYVIGKPQHRIYFFLAIVVSITMVALYLPGNSLGVFIVGEDGFVEWLTVASFFLAFVLAVTGVRLFARQDNKSAAIFYGLVGVVCLLIVAEELSWGQRIFGFEAGSFFQQYNLQGETNIHNIKIGKYSINLLVFSILLENALAIYFFIFPLILNSSTNLRKWTTKIAFPVPAPEHAACFGIMYVLVATNPNGKAWELMELTYGILLCLLLKDTIHGITAAPNGNSEVEP